MEPSPPLYRHLLTVLEQQGQEDLAKGFKKLSAAIARDEQLGVERHDLLENLSVLAEQGKALPHGTSDRDCESSTPIRLARPSLLAAAPQRFGQRGGRRLPASSAYTIELEYHAILRWPRLGRCMQDGHGRDRQIAGLRLSRLICVPKRRRCHSTRSLCSRTNCPMIIKMATRKTTAATKPSSASAM